MALPPPIKRKKGNLNKKPTFSLNEPNRNVFNSLWTDA